MGQCAEQSALARVRVADDGQNRHFTTLSFAPPARSLFGQTAEVALKAGDPLTDPPSIAFELRFSGAAPSDAASQPGQGEIRPLGESRHSVPELSQFDLELSISRRSPLSEDIQDQLGTIDDSELHSFSQIPGLGGVQVLIEDDEIDVLLKATNDQLGELARTDHRLRVHLAARLMDHVCHIQAC
jgi:hypothetical protein